MNDLVFFDDSLTEEDMILIQEQAIEDSNIIENDYFDDFDYMEN